MTSARFSICVFTGDRKYAGKDANIKLKLYDDQGRSTTDMTLDHCFHNDFERGQADTYNFDQLPGDFQDPTRIEFQRDNFGVAPDWYVLKIIVIIPHRKREYVFPVLRWIKADYRYVIHELDTSLPQDDPEKKQRSSLLRERRPMFEYSQKVPGGPMQVKNMPPDEEFSFNYKWDLVKTKVELTVTSEVVKYTSGDWESLGDLKNIYTKKILYLPTGANRWNSDFFFGQQRVASCNPCIIKLCTGIPDKFGVDDDALRPFLEGMTLQQVICEKRLYMVDLDIMKDLPTKDPKYKITAPIALFLVNQKQQLVPIAIQLFQDKGPGNPVFFPTDSPWMLAKMWYNVADASYHQSCVHLGMTHLLMEGVSVATHRNLSHSHPVFKLLAPHFLYLMAINKTGLAVLMSEGGWVDEIMNIGVKGMDELIARGASRWRMDVEGTLPEDLKNRGMDNDKAMPCYPFRDDALLLYRAIKTYVAKYVNLYYTTRAKLSGDYEIQGWARDLSANTADDGLGLKGVPGNGKLTCNEQLTLTLTSVIYTCSVQHAAVNFPQYDEYGFPPNYSAYMKGDPPMDKRPMTEQHVLTTLPDKPTTLDIMVMTKLLSMRGTNKLGDFEVQYIYDPAALKIVDAFKDDLEKIGSRINERNKTRNPPYLFLEPDLVPNSISI